MKLFLNKGSPVSATYYANANTPYLFLYLYTVNTRVHSWSSQAAAVRAHSVFWDSSQWWMMMNWRNSTGFEKLITLMLCSSGFCSAAKKIQAPCRNRVLIRYLKMRVLFREESCGGDLPNNRPWVLVRLFQIVNINTGSVISVLYTVAVCLP